MESLSRACQRLCDSLSRIIREWGTGETSATFEFVAGAPVRFVYGGVRGNRILGMLPCPATSWEFWLQINRDAATASGIPYVWIDATLNVRRRMAQRTKPPPASGDMSAYSSNTGSEVTSPSLLPYCEVKTMFDVEMRRV